MTEESDADQDTEKANRGQGNGPPSYLRGVFIAGAWAFVGLLLVAKFWPNLPQRMAFFTGNLFNLIIAFAVIAQVLIYRKQWDAMQEGLRQSRQSFEISSRAYVGVHSITLDKLTKVVLVRIENVGDLPAERVTLFLKLASFTQEINQSFKEQSVREDYGRTKLFKGNLPILMGFHLRSKWSPEEIKLIEGGSIGLMINGYVSYADGFGSQPNQRTDFFFDYQPEIDCWTTNVADYGDILGYDEEADRKD